jgi:transposase InsO family protein
LLGKGQTGVVAGLDRICEQLPFRLHGLHPDTGSEFINFHLFDYCKDRGIEFTRSRPYHKNDNGHVEQKNWTVVRRLIGYDRLDTPAQQAWLDAFYADDLRPFANCFQPGMKLAGKETVGERTRRLYGTPKTSLRRLLDNYTDHGRPESNPRSHRPLQRAQRAQRAFMAG